MQGKEDNIHGCIYRTRGSWEWECMERDPKLAPHFCFWLAYGQLVVTSRIYVLSSYFAYVLSNTHAHARTHTHTHTKEKNTQTHTKPREFMNNNTNGSECRNNEQNSHAEPDLIASQYIVLQ